MLKKITAIIITLSLLVGLMPSTIALASDDSIILADLSDISEIQKIGMPPSSAHTKSGAYTMLWKGSDLYKNINIPVTRNDISSAKYLEFWVYSAKATQMEFTIGLISDNPQTYCTDYYSSTIKVNWTGWRIVSLSYGDEGIFEKTHSPLGFDKISEIRLWPTYKGSVPVDGTELYIDTIYCTKEQNPAIAASKEYQGTEYIIADFSNPVAVKEAGYEYSTAQKKNGEGSLLWGGTKVEGSFQLKVPTDWTPYDTLVINMYNEKETNIALPLIIRCGGPNSGWYYYSTTIELNWEGWAELKFSLKYDFNKARDASWSNVTELLLSPGFSDGDFTKLRGKKFYFDSIYLMQGGIDDYVPDSVNDYIPGARQKEFYGNWPEDVWSHEENKWAYVDCAEMVKEKYPDGTISHPRLLTYPGWFEEAKELIKTNTYMKTTYAYIKAAADTNLTKEPAPYSASQNTGLFRDGIYSMREMALAYKLSGEEKYKERLWKELEAVCNYPNWYPQNMLSVGETALCVALCYDWLYYDWTPAQRRILRNTLVHHAFEPTLKQYRYESGVAVQRNNWTEVTGGGVGMAALAFCDEEGYGPICNEILNEVAEAFPYGLQPYAPSGASPEGPGYWSYGHQYTFNFIYSMNVAMDYDFGLSEYPGIENSCYFPIAMAGPTGKVFNYGDSGEGVVRSGFMFLAGELFDKPEFGGYVLESGTQGTWMDMVSYRNEAKEADFKSITAKDNYFSGSSEVASVRSSWNDNNALFVAFKGGDNQSSHGDMDQGTFVLDALGERWVVDLGSETYTNEGNWDFSPTGGRWTYYRKNPEGANTLIINPCDKPAQNAYAKAKIEKFQKADGAAYGIINLTESYKDYANSVKRGVALINNRSAVLIQDEIQTKSPSEIYSFFHTNAQIELDASKKTAIMTLAGKKMKVQLLSDDGIFEIMDAVPLETSAPPMTANGNSVNVNVRKLAVHMTNVTNPTISVLFTPVADGQPEIATPRLMSIDSWDSYLDNNISLTSLKVDNVQVANFTGANMFYTIDTGILGTVSAEADENVDISIVQAQSVGDTAYVTVTSKEDGSQAVYSVNFTQRNPKLFSNLSSDEIYTIKSVKASDVPEVANIPDMTFDGDLITRWAAEGQQWIEYDLGEVVPINCVMLAFMNGSARKAFFSIELSEDGKNYNSVFDGSSSGTIDGFENYSFSQEDARYVRINVKGNSVNLWNSLCEISIPKVKEPFDDVKTHWAKDDIMLLNSIGLVNGVSDESFAPDAMITRAEFIAILQRGLNLPEADYMGELADVDINAWYAPNVASLKNSGIIPDEMLANNMLLPDTPIMREEIAALIVRAYEMLGQAKIENQSVDFMYDIDEASEYTKEYIKKGIIARLIKGTSETTFSPKANATRAEATVMVKRLLTQVAE